MDAFDGLNTTNHTFSPVQLSDYKEQVTYDPNGNILSYNRNGYTGGGTAMDVLTYNYNHPTTNQLSSISDAGGGTYTTDIKDLGTGDNYHYDQIGNLILDGANTISWTVYGKILTQSGLSGSISYAYDAGINRITKTTSSGTTLYVRDAQGNVLSTYQQPAGGSFAQSEIDLFGSSRLGLLRSPTLPTETIALSGGGMAYVTSFTRGLKSYELSNHLGNVLATITDKKIAVSSGSNSSLIDHFTADVVTAQDYYPFGMIMPGRSLVAAGAGNYRYGFNGKENDNEVKGVGDQVDYGMRAYDPRVGRFMSVDPVYGKFPMLTPYQYASNTPIQAIDLDGLEKLSATGGYPGNDIYKLPSSIDIRSSDISFAPGRSSHSATQTASQANTRRFIQVAETHCHPSGQAIADRINADYAAAYAKLDHEHGQVDFPRTSFLDKLDEFWNGPPTFSGLGPDGKTYHNNIINRDGYVTDLVAPNTLTFPNYLPVEGPPGLAQEEELISIYRNFGENEMASLVKNGYRFGIQEGGNIGKDFWLTEEGLNAWNATKFSKMFSAEIKVDRKLLDMISKESFFTDNLPGGAHNAISLDAKDLDLLNKFVKSISISTK